MKNIVKKYYQQILSKNIIKKYLIYFTYFVFLPILFFFDQEQIPYKKILNEPTITNNRFFFITKGYKY